MISRGTRLSQLTYKQVRGTVGCARVPHMRQASKGPHVAWEMARASQCLLCACLAALVLAGAVSAAGRQYVVGGFNIQIFGAKKMANADVVSVLLRILPFYDALLIMEVRDSTDTAIHNLLADLNAKTDPAMQYSMLLSDRLGRSNSKEQYAYFYRTALFDVVGSETYVFNDAQNWFERPPYVATFAVRNSTGAQRFTTIGIHTKPEDSVNEIDHLTDVYNAHVQRFAQADVLLLGDMNAGCSYVPKKSWPDIRLWSDTRFLWHISSDDDTTVGTTSCPYDRLVTAGALSGRVVPGSTVILRYDDAFGLTPDEAKAVSDHYNVWLRLAFNVSDAGGGSPAPTRAPPAQPSAPVPGTNQGALSGQSSKSSVNVAAIAGGVAGGVVLVACAVGLVVWFKRSSREDKVMSAMIRSASAEALNRNDLPMTTNPMHGYHR